MLLSDVRRLKAKIATTTRLQVAATELQLYNCILLSVSEAKLTEIFTTTAKAKFKADHPEVKSSEPCYSTYTLDRRRFIASFSDDDKLNMAATSALGEVMTAALNDDRAFKHIKADALQAWEATCHLQLSDVTSFPLRMKLLAALHKLFLARPSTLSANLTLASDRVLEDNASHRKARLKIKQFQQTIDSRVTGNMTLGHISSLPLPSMSPAGLSLSVAVDPGVFQWFMEHPDYGHFCRYDNVAGACILKVSFDAALLDKTKQDSFMAMSFSFASGDEEIMASRTHAHIGG